MTNGDDNQCRYDKGDELGQKKTVFRENFHVMPPVAETALKSAKPAF